MSHKIEHNGEERYRSCRLLSSTLIEEGRLVSELRKLQHPKNSAWLQTVQHILQCRRCCGTAVSCGSRSQLYTHWRPPSRSAANLSQSFMDVWISRSTYQLIGTWQSYVSRSRTASAQQGATLCYSSTLASSNWSNSPLPWSTAWYWTVNEAAHYTDCK